MKKIKDMPTEKNENLTQSFFTQSGNFNQVNNDESEIESLIGIRDIKIFTRFFPRRLPDDIVNYCKICDRKFGFFVRKHYCQKCRDIFCDKCSNVYNFFYFCYTKKVKYCISCDKLKSS